ncbi:hypothetical protein RF11_12702 [Thelohanellus kitauei]|uniref:ISXO2-like transposase domain-containing protein n=1 Tax=Thelohanellus kitauei TaxID=669202 RepID=A0A0C2IMP8_THEKT|nr:hypothetical protein RF11_12702 [Thelohanellus kitauei]
MYYQGPTPNSTDDGFLKICNFTLFPTQKLNYDPGLYHQKRRHNRVNRRINTGENKYQQGHIASAAWILGGVERKREKNAKPLINIIRRHVLPDCTITTECFRSYSKLSSYYEHLTVNHSQTFINWANGACTNTIERTRKNSYNEDGNTEENTIDQFLENFHGEEKILNISGKQL